ncbi:MAG: hypothetical protein HOE30_05175 [Deltaproteobacteria bacterium]|jgi:hypothetical protein|nr:hypothetical protein [Deltaproteobacteria bacterium]MBT7713748.1 hypothetical protein [Deltaproteobacteria bacterium]
MASPLINKPFKETESTRAVLDDSVQNQATKHHPSDQPFKKAENEIICRQSGVSQTDL